VADVLLTLQADAILEVADSQLIPRGTLLPVAGTPFDFTHQRAARVPELHRHVQLQHANGFDHCWVLNPARTFDAELISPHSGITLRLSSSQPGLQFYGGQWLARAHPGLNGLCLEPEQFPNAINEPRFPSPVLRPGEIGRVTISYQFAG